LSNGANSPLEFPTKVGTQNTAGIMSAGDWFPGSTAAGSADFTAAYIKANGGTADTIDNSSAEAFACGQLLEAVAAKTGKIDNATIITSLHQGEWPTVLGNLSWGPDGAPFGQLQPHPVAERQARSGLPRSSGKGNACLSQAQLGRVTD